MLQFRVDIKEEIEMAEIKQGYILERIESLKKNEIQNYEIDVLNDQLDENEKTLKKLSK